MNPAILEAPVLPIPDGVTIRRTDTPFGNRFDIDTPWGQAALEVPPWQPSEISFAQMMEGIEKMRAGFEALAKQIPQIASNLKDLKEGALLPRTAEPQVIPEGATIIDEDEAVALLWKAVAERGQTFVDHARSFIGGCIVGWAIGGLLGQRGEWAPTAGTGLFTGWRLGEGHLAQEGGYYFTRAAERILERAMGRNDEGWPWGRIAAEAQSRGL